AHKGADFFKPMKEMEMGKLLTYVVAALFAVASVNAMAAKHMAAEKGASAEKKEMKADKKAPKKAKKAKKAETKYPVSVPPRGGRVLPCRFALPDLSTGDPVLR